MIAGRLGEYIEAEMQRDLDDDTLHGAKRCLVDWFATTVPGGVLPPATLLIEALSEETGAGSAELVPRQTVTSARTAALINGAAAHTVEFDDIWRDGIYHPGAPVIAAALATAQAEDLDGRAFLNALIIGYEVSNRVAALVNPAHYTYWHTTATVGHLGAAAAAAAAMRLTAEQCGHALGNVTSFMAGLQQAFRSDAMTKPFHVGQAAANGVLSAQAARSGVTSAREMLEGEVGFGKAMSDGPDFNGLFHDLGSFYTVCHVTQKNHGCCGHTFAALDGALELRSTHGFDFDDIQSIHVDTYSAAVDICGGQTPTTPTEARFSLPYVMAAAMRFGSVRLVAFEPRYVADPDLLEFASRVSVKVDAALDAKFPRSRSATVTIDLRDGRSFSLHCPTRKGDPENPLTDAEIDAKYTELVTPVLGDQSRALLSTLWAVEQEASVRTLVTRHAGSVKRAHA